MFIRTLYEVYSLFKSSRDSIIHYSHHVSSCHRLYENNYMYNIIEKYIMLRMIAAALVAVLAIWSIVFAILFVSDEGDSDFTKYYSYTTFGVAPVVGAVIIWLILAPGNK